MKDDARARFITVDKHEAVTVGDLEKTLDSLSVVKPKMTAEFPEAVVRKRMGLLGCVIFCTFEMF